MPLGGNAMIHESDIVCGGDWMCLTEAELEGFSVENIAGAGLGLGLGTARALPLHRALQHTPHCTPHHTPHLAPHRHHRTTHRTTHRVA